MKKVCVTCREVLHVKGDFVTCGYVTLGQVVWYKGSNMAFFSEFGPPPPLPFFAQMSTFFHCLFFETELDIKYKDPFSVLASFVSCFLGASRLVSAKVKKKG